MKIFVVLGMHRSATSLIAKGLHDCGVDMGEEFLEPNEGNPEGYWECVEAIEINDRILEAAGGSWDEPPSKRRIEATELDDVVIDYINRRSTRSVLWGWKDPRTVITWPVWDRNLIGDVHIIYLAASLVASKIHSGPDPVVP